MSNPTGVTNWIWMGGLEHYMSEAFIMTAFLKMGEKPTAVKVMRNRYTGEPTGYAFIYFHSEEEAKRVMHKLNSCIIPNTLPPARFRLNFSSGKGLQTDNEYSLFVGDLSPNVDDYQLYKTFASRYQSVKTAQAMVDSNGFCKGYGFVRFFSEDDQKHCLNHMNGFKGLGIKPIKVSLAVQKMPRSGSGSGGYSSSQDCSSEAKADTNVPPTSKGSSNNKISKTNNNNNNNNNNSNNNGISDKSYEAAYWQNYSAWQWYGETNSSMNHKLPPEVFSQLEPNTLHGDDLELIEHSTKMDIESSNRELIQRDYNLWDALECSKWTPVDCYELYSFIV